MYTEKTYSIFLEQGDQIKAFSISLGAHDFSEYSAVTETAEKVIAEFLNALEVMDIIEGHDIGVKVKTYGKQS